MDELKKAKLIYSGELLLFTIVFIVLGVLMLLGILGNKDLFKQIFSWVTLFGSTWLIVDFFWVLLSKKRRAKNSLLDKALLLPSASCTIAFDIFCLINGPLNVNDLAGVNLYGYYCGSLFMYFAAVYLFQAIYHYFYPIPGLLEDDKKAEEKENIPAETEQNDEKQE